MGAAAEDDPDLITMLTTIAALTDKKGQKRSDKSRIKVR
jgi:hypothetical protein